MKREREIIAIAAIVAIIAVSLWYYTPESRHAGGKAMVIVSLNYGAKTILKKEVKAGESAIEALKSVANVSTSYGGSFVSGINGIYGNENRKMAWFYYINGMLSNVGASKYILHNGDVMRWDYHFWGDNLVIYGELGDFPEPLVHGYGGKTRKTLLVYDEEFKGDAKILYNYLKKYCDMEIKSPEALNNSEMVSDNIIVLGNNNSLAQKLNSMHEQLGFYYYLENGVVKDINETSYRGGFAELAQSPFNPKGNWACENAVLLISGERGYVHEVVENLINGTRGFWAFEGEKA